MDTLIILTVLSMMFSCALFKSIHEKEYLLASAGGISYVLSVLILMNAGGWI